MQVQQTTEHVFNPVQHSNSIDTVQLHETPNNIVPQAAVVQAQQTITRILAQLACDQQISTGDTPRGMSLIARTAGIGRSTEELQWDL